MAQDEQDRAGATSESPPTEPDTGPQPLARVRYSFGKELQLFPDSFVLLRREEAEADRVELSSVKRLILTPGEPNPSKLLLMFDLDDGNTIIAAEGMTAVAEFRALLAKLREIAPQIELDPPDLDDQLKQALDIRRRSLIGCYGSILAACLLIWIVYLAVAFFGAHAH
ncbi:MAG TPA: hypothetical protein VF808_08895 [Ktedonobacterales bacterium]